MDFIGPTWFTDSVPLGIVSFIMCNSSRCGVIEDKRHMFSNEYHMSILLKYRDLSFVLFLIIVWLQKSPQHPIPIFMELDCTINVLWKRAVQTFCPTSLCSMGWKGVDKWRFSVLDELSLLWRLGEQGKWISLREQERKHTQTAALSSATLSALARSGRVKAFPLLSHSTWSLIGEIIYMISTQWVIHWDSHVWLLSLPRADYIEKKANVR